MKRVAFLTCGLAVAFGSVGWTQATQRVSVTWNGAQANGGSWSAAVSGNGCYVAFVSAARNLVPGDTNWVSDVFLRDRWSGLTERISVHSSGGQGNGHCDVAEPSISADGRYVAFSSRATNLVTGDTNGRTDVFVRDRLTGITERVNVASSGAEADSQSLFEDQYGGGPKISDDGRYVAFMSWATNLVPGDSNGQVDVFVRDRQAGTTEIVSVDSSGTQANGGSWVDAISARGRHVAFTSRATNLVPGDTSSEYDVFVRDRRTGMTERASVDSNSGAGGSISADGRYVAFNSQVGMSNMADIFVRDRQAGTTTLIAHHHQGWSQGPSISADGRFVAYGVLEMDAHVYLYDRLTGQTEQIAGGEEDSYPTSISADGRFVAFESGIEDFVPDDTNWSFDVFLYDRAPGYARICDPGAPGVIDCPCGNPAVGIGCDNSAGTGGANLSSLGGAYLSSDNLRFETFGQQPNMTSILIQATRSVPTGVVFGQGVRCFGGTLTRLYTRHPPDGFTVPDYSAGDQQIHSRSATLGDPIAAGSTRWYAVIYRDPIVQGGCPATSTFNTSQTIEVPWLP